MVQTPSPGSRQPTMQELTFQSNLIAACGSGTSLATWQTPNYTEMWEVRQQAQQRLKRKQVGTVLPWFLTLRGVAGPRWLCLKLGQPAAAAPRAASVSLAGRLLVRKKPLL